MHPKVRDLYKRIIHVGRDYPKGLPWVRDKAKAWFLQNKDVKDETELKKCIALGRHQVREMVAVISLKKYRHLKHTYYDEDALDQQSAQSPVSQNKSQNL